MNILFLDDNPVRTAKFQQTVPSATTVETAKDCIKQLNTEEWDWVFLDHDLGGEEFVDSDRPDTGMEVVRHLVKNQPDKRPQIVVHSLNLDARKRMCLDLTLAGYDALPIAFPLIFQFLDEKILR